MTTFEAVGFLEAVAFAGGFLKAVAFEAEEFLEAVAFEALAFECSFEGVGDI